MLSIHKASAGSGKTFQLAYDYIRFLLTDQTSPKSPDATPKLISKKSSNPYSNTDVNHSHILAITFTNKATEEMKRRIIKELCLLANTSKKSNYRKNLIAYFNTDEKKLADAAKLALYDVLFIFSYFNISTIDSFFQQVIRTFAAEIDRPDDFEVSLAENDVLRIVVSNILNKTGNSDSPIHQWIKKYITKIINDGGYSNIFDRDQSAFRTLISDINKLMNEDYKRFASELNTYLQDTDKLLKFEDWLKDQNGPIRSFERINKDNVDNVYKLLEEYECLSFFKKKALFDKIRESKIDENIPDDTYPNSYFNRTQQRRRTPIENTNHEDLKNAILKTITDYKAFLSDKTYFTAKVLLKNIYALGLLSEVRKGIEKYCTDNDIVLVSSSTEFISKILKCDDVPFIYDRLGVRLRHFLMDEFQDTSKMQWENMMPLLKESMANGNDNLIIGDVKQCIYRFRNSDPELLNTEVQNDLEPNKVVGNIISENTNWRSAPTIIRFNNTLFSSMSLDTNFGQPNPYYTVAQAIPGSSKDIPGYVRLQILHDMQNELELLKNDLKTLIETRHFLPSDIAILYRDGDENANSIIDAINDLKNKADDNSPLKSIGVQIDKGKKISNAPSIKIIVNTIRAFVQAIDDNDDGHHANAKDQKMPFATFSALFENAIAENPENPNNATDAFISTFLNGNNDIKQDLDFTLNADDIGCTVDNIIATLPASLIERDNQYIHVFQDAVIDFAQKNNPDLDSFLDWWDNFGEKNTCISSPKDPNNITILTVHKAKGLEFPVVLLPFVTKWNFLNTGHKAPKKWVNINADDIFPDIPENLKDCIPPYAFIQSDKDCSLSHFKDEAEKMAVIQRIDELNSLYVALTRAKNVLIAYISGQTKDSKGNDRETASRYIINALDRLERETDIIASSEGKLNEDIRLYLTDIKTREYSYTENTNDDNGNDIQNEIVNKTYFLGKLFDRPQEKSNDDATDITPAKCQSHSMPLYFPKTDDDPNAMNNTEYIKPLTTTPDNFDPNDARQKGTFLHHVLSDIVYPEDLNWAFLRWTNIVGIDSDTAAKWKKELKTALEYSSASPWFVNFKQIFNEMPIISENGDIKRPDRVVMTQDGFVDIIDYKTGNDQYQTKYTNQVSEYVKIYKNLGFKNVRGYIWYFLNNNIVTVYDDSTIF
ncbi:MAG: UvrD-helicase domain-containing protein [Muribaculaceae bacterium]